MKYLTTNEIRNIWLNFFKDKEHAVEESASLIPNDDPTLLWINAGVAPLKKYFDGRVIPQNPRIVNAQKCIRTNDIENVGHTARHHTFFEMLGNFSIGDYFRDEIIPWAYDLLFNKKYYGFEQEKIYITVYPSDTDTYQAWLDVGIDPSHLIRCEHNFWEIGEGPCGPDTEIFYDRGPEYGDHDISVIEHDIENDRYIEIWNIVFSQFNSKAGQKRSEYKELPSKNIDTGMGLERMACVIQGVDTNYETDTFMSIIKEIEKISGVTYQGQLSFKVIADHVRSVTFAVNDGALLSNEGRGYVLRRLLRRAVKHGVQLGIQKPFLHELVDAVVASFGSFYKSLTNNVDLIKHIIKLEEVKFLETLSQGEKLLDDFLANTEGKVLAGKDAFQLYDTYGFPIELTEEIASSKGFTVDRQGFKEEMQQQKERARAARKNDISMNIQNEAFIAFKEPSEFTGYTSLQENTTVLKSFPEGVVLTKTPFYAESGGQVADKGVILHNNTEYNVLDVQKLPNGQFLHIIGDSELQDGDEVVAKVDERLRNLTVYNHSATHLMFAALREIVGSHVSQQGSQVSEEHLRFDFNNFTSLDDETLLKIEQKVNEVIQTKYHVQVNEMSIDEAKELGAIAEFGEKYEDKVRVVNMGYTIDLCGGTHVKNLGDIERFAIASIESKGSGIYRIVGHANDAIENIREQFVGFHKEMDKLLVKVDNILSEAKENNINLSFSFSRNEEILGSYQDIINKRQEFQQLGEMARELEKELKLKLKEQTFTNIDAYLKDAVDNKLVLLLHDIDKSALKPLVDRLLDKLGTGVVFVANVVENKKVTFICKTNQKEYHAGNIAKEAAMITGGNGGGRPDMAQAGGRDINKVSDAIAHVKGLLG